MQMAAAALRIMYLPFLPLKTRNKITILSRQSDSPTVDIKLLTDELRRSEAVECVVLTKCMKKTVPGALRYSLHMLRQMYHISTSYLLVIDGHCILASLVHKKKGQRIVQIWHSLGAIKKFGYQSLGKPYGNSAEAAGAMKMYANYDYVTAPSRITAKYYSEAFGISPENVKIYGLPRIDYLLRSSSGSEKIERVYPEIRAKKNILYAPTFRKGSNMEHRDFIENADLEKYNLIIKQHWLDGSDLGNARSRGVIVDEKFDTFEWLQVCDKVVTDYSGVAFEAAILEKELYFYPEDLEEYEENIGLNMDFHSEPIAPYVCADAGKLWEAIDRPYNKKRVKEFKERYIETDAPVCTSRLAGFLLGLREGAEIRYEHGDEH